MRRLPLLALLTLIAGCAPKAVPLLPEVNAPKYPDFIVPVLPPALAASVAADSHARGWRFLQAGDLKNAEREFTAASRAMPPLEAAETDFGYLELARKNAKEALAHFDRALERQPQDFSTLVGKSQALVSLDRDAEAVPVLEAALAANPAASDLARRAEVLRFRSQQEDLNQGRRATREGRLDEAVAAYTRAIASSPDSAFLYRELAAVEHQRRDDEQALEHFRQAVALDSADARSLIQIGEILEGRGDLDGAAKAYNEALALEPSDAAERRLEGLRSRAALATLPEEYRAIDSAPEITRGDLAALIGVRLNRLLQEREPRAVVITDLRNEWAAAWIMQVARAGIMDAFVNHTFQPRAVVRRVDLAEVVSRLLGRVSVVKPGADSWRSARVRFSDLAPSHLAYGAASAAVASGVMTLAPNDSFLPTRPVSGREALDAIARIEGMIGGASSGKTSR